MHRAGARSTAWLGGQLWLCLVVFFIVSLDVAGAERFEPRAIRALFDEDYYWVSKSGADHLVRSAKAAGFTMIVPCVWHGRGTAWKSELAPLDDRLDPKAFSGRDPLRYLIDTAGANGIEVHPWFTVFLRQREFNAQWTDGWNTGMFDVHSAGYAKWMSSLIEEVVAKYPVNGINLDYVRTLEVCRSESCQKRYRAETGRDLLRDIATSGIVRTSRESVAAWQRAAVLRALREISEAARSKRQILISVDTIVGADGWDLKGADGIGWLKAGVVDVVFHMDYRPQPDLERFHAARSSIEDGSRVLLLVANYKEEEKRGLNSRSRAADHLVRLVKSGQQPMDKKIEFGVYEYRFLTDAQIGGLRQYLDQATSLPQ